MSTRTNPLPLVGVAPMAAMPGLVSPVVSASAALYAMSDNPFDIDYTVTGEVTYSETNHRATFSNSTSVISVARLLTGYGVAGQIRAIEFESVVKPAQVQMFGLRPSLTQGTTSTSLRAGVNDVEYETTGDIYVNTVQVATGLATLAAGGKVTIIYYVTLGKVEFRVNGTSIYTATGISGDMTPACQGSNNNTHAIRVSTSSSYPLPADVLYWR